MDTFQSAPSLFWLFSLVSFAYVLAGFRIFQMDLPKDWFTGYFIFAVLISGFFIFGLVAIFAPVLLAITMVVMGFITHRIRKIAPRFLAVTTGLGKWIATSFLVVSMYLLATA